MFHDCYINEAILICPLVSFILPAVWQRFTMTDETVSSGVLIFMPDFSI
jgi:hypothetical protein